ncbi:MAG TPA: hypothetical protein VL197_04075, partial [Nitrospirota bacterium]|nr:hypothetical protein [Nitrospirota bacterium]
TGGSMTPGGRTKAGKHSGSISTATKSEIVLTSSKFYKKRMNDETTEPISKSFFPHRISDGHSRTSGIQPFSGFSGCPLSRA